jgi:hypothetical protein
MIDDDVGVMLLSPLLAEGLVEPSVVGGNEMAPLKYFQRLLLRCSLFRKQKKRAGTHAHRERAGACPFNEVST